MKSVGAPIDRVDARKKVTGEATYAADVEVARIAHAVIVTSTIARGHVDWVDVSAAEHLPGVLAVITHTNAPHVAAGKTGSGPAERVLQLLQDDEGARLADHPDRGSSSPTRSSARSMPPPSSRRWLSLGAGRSHRSSS